MNWNLELRERIASNLQRFPRLTSESGKTRAAVAMVVLRGRQKAACVPLFLRSKALSTHAGQYGLPGGKMDGTEDAVAAVLRELHEELGVIAPRDHVLGALDDYDTRSGFAITPLVVWSSVTASSLRPAAAEVARLFVLSLVDLQSAVEEADAGTSPTFALRFRWGPVLAPTAAILFQFSEVALSGRPCRVNDFYQPPFAWR